MKTSTVKFGWNQQLSWNERNVIEYFHLKKKREIETKRLNSVHLVIHKTAYFDNLKFTAKNLKFGIN